MNGSSLVLEADGTELDNGVVLKMFHTQTLILLSKNEKWSYETNLDVSFSSGTSTVTVSTYENSTEDVASVVIATTCENATDGVTDRNNSNGKDLGKILPFPGICLETQGLQNVKMGQTYAIILINCFKLQ